MGKPSGLGERDLMFFEGDKRVHGAPGVTPATRAMAMTDPKRLTACSVTHGPAHAAALDNSVSVHRCLRRYMSAIGRNLWKLGKQVYQRHLNVRSWLKAVVRTDAA